MWRREMIRVILALNWCLAGIAFANAIYAHDNRWYSFCLHIADEDMRAAGIQLEGENHWRERYRRGDEIRARFNEMKTWGRVGWILATIATVGTAIGLMIAFPQPAGPPLGQSTPEAASERWVQRTYRDGSPP